MPSVSLTPSQEAQIKAANDALSAAKSTLDSSTASANDYLAALNRCHCGKGKRIGGTCTPLRTTYTFPNLANLNDCIEPPNINKLVTDCGKQSTCKDRVTQYNDKISIYNTAKSNYDLAKSNYDAVMAEISKDPTVAANTSIINSEIDAQKSKDNVKWLFFGLAAVLIVGGAIFIGVKLLGGRSAA